MLHEFFCQRLTKFYWRDLIHFSLMAVPGSLIWACHTTREKSKKQISREEMEKLPISLWILGVAFYIIELGSVNNSAVGRAGSLSGGDWTGQRFVPPPVCHVWKVSAVAASDGNREEMCDVINPHSQATALWGFLPKSWSNRPAYCLLMQLFVVVRACSRIFHYRFELLLLHLYPINATLNLRVFHDLVEKVPRVL